MDTGFRLEVRTEGAATVIAVGGELDLASSPALKEQLERISGPETELLVIDLRELEFMDSTGLSIIVGAHNRLAEQGCHVSIVRGTQQVQRLLDLTGVAERMRIVDTPEEALNGG